MGAFKVLVVGCLQSIQALCLRVISKGQKRVMIYVSDRTTGSAADLRATSLVRPLEALGWEAMVARPNLDQKWRQRLNRCFQPHAILMQKARHPLNRPHLYPGIPCVVDVDDADMHDPKGALTEQKVYADAAEVICGSRYIASQVRPFNPKVTTVWTCTYIQQAQVPVSQTIRAQVVCWAASDPAGYPLELAFVQQVVLSLHARAPGFEFWIYGFKGGNPLMQSFVATLQSAGVTVRTWGSMPYRDFVESLTAVAVGLNPVCEDNLFSRGKSFGKLLAYMAADVAIVGTGTLDYPLFFDHGHSALMLENDPQEWGAQVANLLAAPARRAAIASEARQQFENRLSTQVAAERLAQVLDRVSGA